MASAGIKTGGGGDASDAEECRHRRRRRLAMRRHAAAASGGGGETRSSGVSGGGSGEKRSRPPPASLASGSSSEAAAPESEEEEEEENWVGGLPAAAARWPVAFGSVSVAGRMREMEDTVSVRPGFFVNADGSPAHFFGVFDGHGGPHVAALCRERMHVILAEELAAAADANVSREAEEAGWRSALSRCFARVDALAEEACACGRVADPPCRCELSREQAAIVGSTAVVALLVGDRIVVANCGDSRAVLCRAGTGVPLSSDQKPDRPDEKTRIEAAGGRVVYLNGARVRGILAMSRALGDKLLRPEVICEPEIMVTERTSEDECLILASDGMWDVISNDTACDVARQCLEDGNPLASPRTDGDEVAPRSVPGEQESEPRCHRAAVLLARLALGRESSDNISVIVIDLKRRV